MQKNMKEKLSFVIPCYYSEKTIGDVLKRIIATVNEDGRYDYEIICVNDGSTDGTYAVLRELAANPHIKVVDLSRNFGQHSALMAGFRYVTGNIIVFKSTSPNTTGPNSWTAIVGTLGFLIKVRLLFV